jgi:hypothetical protein
MGWLRKKGKQLRRGIKKIGRKIGKAFKSILKPFAKIFNKFGPLGSMAMMFILPGIGQMLSGFGANWVTSTLGKFAGNVVKHVGNAINFVATAPQKIFQTITGGIRAGWNGLFGGQAGTMVDGNVLGVIDPVTGKAPTSWWDSFTNDVRSKWGNNNLEGLNNAWDVSGAGKAKLDSFVGDFQKMGGEIKDVFKPDTREAITQIEADTLLENMDPSILEKNYKIVPEGALAKLRQGTGTLTKKIGDVTVPGVGDVGDVAWGTSAALGTYSTLAQYGVVGSDDDVRGGSGMGYAATDQLGSIEDQGPLIQPWSFDQNISVAQNNTNAQNTWNTSLGFPQGFDPSATPGYGFSYQQWLQQQMAA